MSLSNVAIDFGHLVLGGAGLWLLASRSTLIDAVRVYKDGFDRLFAKKTGPDVAPSKVDFALAKTHVSEIQDIVLGERNAFSNLQTVCKKAIADRNELDAFNRDVLSRLRTESAVLPSALEWVERLQEMIDARDSGYLIQGKRKAIKKDEAIKQANAEKRELKKEISALKNLLAMYEKQVPWLSEIAELSLQDVLDGLRIQQQLEDENNDPVAGYLSATEFATLSSTERNQRALDRYFEYRQRNAALAGRLYERYVGYLCEKAGWSVKYQGATQGVADEGLDLICTCNGNFMLVQCKRLSKLKGHLVRENTVAQTYGAARYFALKCSLSPENVQAKIITTSELSEEAKTFAAHLNVTYYENVQLDRYPCIKCNISQSGERIYHLPMDQQYDKVVINQGKGECYATTVSEAEELGFRRAYRWRGTQ